MVQFVKKMGQIFNFSLAEMYICCYFVLVIATGSILHPFEFQHFNVVS
jgi:hypothetical protein